MAPPLSSQSRTPSNLDNIQYSQLSRFKERTRSQNELFVHENTDFPDTASQDEVSDGHSNDEEDDEEPEEGNQVIYLFKFV